MNIEATDLSIAIPIMALLIEDNPGDAGLFREMLAEAQNTSFSLEYADRLSAGLERLALGGIDLLLLDLSLSDSQGLDTLVRARAQAPQTPIVVLSGLDDEALAVQAVRAGAQDYLVKGQADSRLLVRAMRYAIERKQAEEALRHYAAELQARNDELDAFAHTVAHDLKSPLGNILGYIDLLNEFHAEMSNAERQEHLDAVRWMGRKMTNIIDELLLLAEVGKVDVENRPLDMGCIVDNARQRLADLIERSHAEISLPPAWPEALGYAPWVEEVWVNYLSNGLKYGGRPPRLELGAACQADSMIRFWVRDNGRGLSPEEQAQLFTPFTRLSQVRASGHGLGLSIVRRIVDKLGGTVGVESEGVPGRGSIFIFALPAPTAVRPGRPPYRPAAAGIALHNSVGER